MSRCGSLSSSISADRAVGALLWRAARGGGEVFVFSRGFVRVDQDSVRIRQRSLLTTLAKKIQKRS